MTDRYALHPSEVSVVRNPDGSIHAYIWEPGPEAGPWANPGLIGRREPDPRPTWWSRVRSLLRRAS